MDRIVISDSGFPLDNETIRRMQDSYNGMFEGVATSLGNNVILSGVDLVNGNRTDGWIVYENELLPFIGGVDTDRFKIVEIQTDVFYDNGDAQPLPAYLKRYATVSSTTPNLDINILKRINTLEQSASSRVNGIVQSSDSLGETFYGNILNFELLNDPALGDYFKVTIENQLSDYVPIVVNSSNGNPEAFNDFIINNITVNSFDIWVSDLDTSGEFFVSFNIQIIV